MEISSKRLKIWFYQNIQLFNNFIFISLYSEMREFFSHLDNSFQVSENHFFQD